jgi:3-methyladenine DNA glycosylase Tag
MNSIDNINNMMGISSSYRQSASLTDDQKQQAQSILSKYDPKSVTAQDAQSIFKQLMDAGIHPGKDLRDAIKTAGFDPQNLRTMAFNAMQASHASPQDAALTDEQKKKVQSILSQYDPKSLTAADAQSIFKQLQQAGIRPGKELRDGIEAAGFNMPQLTSLAAPRGETHPSFYGGNALEASPAKGINNSALQTLQSILNQYDLKNLNTDQQKSLMAQLDQAGLLQSGTTINVGV